MKKPSPSVLIVLLVAAWSCGAAQRSSTKQAQSAISSQDACATFLTTTQRLMSAVLDALPRVYTAMAGEIVRIQEVKTNVYEVWILHEERTEVVTFETAMNPECHATAVRVTERLAESRAR